MKKIALLGILLILGSDTLLAQYQDNTACEKSEIKWLTNNKRYFEVSGPIDEYSKTLANIKTMKIDRENKTVDVELIDIITKRNRELHIKYKGPAYAQFGFWDVHLRFNYEKMTMQEFSSYWKNCNGDIIDEIHYEDSTETDLKDNSRAKDLNAIVKKYNLK